MTRLALARIFHTVLVSSVLIIILIIRFEHASWASPSGLMLLGGQYSSTRTEKIQEDGTSTNSFELKYSTV